MHDLVTPFGGSTTNDRLLNTNNTKMPQSRQQRSMMKNHMSRKLRNKDLCLCDTTRCGFIFNFPNYSMLQLFTNASVNPTEAFNDRCSGFFMHLPTTLIWPRKSRLLRQPSNCISRDARCGNIRFRGLLLPMPRRSWIARG